MNITIVNAFGDGNVGGAAITFAAVQLAIEIDPEAHISIVKVGPTADYPYSLGLQPHIAVLDPALRYTKGTRLEAIAASITGFMVPRWAAKTNSTVRALAASDVVIAKGGFVFRERESGLKGLLSGWFTAWPFLVATRLNALTIAYSASIGPFNTVRSRLLARFILSRVDLVCPRDPSSEIRAVTELSISRDKLMNMPDCVFGLAGDTRLVSDHPTTDRDQVALIPRDLSGLEWDAFIYAAQSAREKTDTKGIVVLVQASEDLAAAERLITEMKLDQSDLKICSDPREVVEACQAAQLVVSCRMHGSIFSLIAHTPTILFDIDRGKAGPVLESLDLQRFLIPFATPRADVDRLIDDALSQETVEQVISRVASVGAAAREVRASVAERLRTMRSARAAV